MIITEDLIKGNIENRKYSFETGYTIILMIANLLINIGIFNWLNNVNKCECSKINNDNTILKLLCTFIIIWNIFILVIFIIYDANPETYPLIIKYMIPIVMIIIIIYLVKLYIYISNLQKINCDCGLIQEEKLIYYYLLLQFSIFIFVLLLLLIISFYIMQ